MLLSYIRICGMVNWVLFAPLNGYIMMNIQRHQGLIQYNYASFLEWYRKIWRCNRKTCLNNRTHLVHHGVRGSPQPGLTPASCTWGEQVGVGHFTAEESTKPDHISHRGQPCNSWCRADGKQQWWLWWHLSAATIKWERSLLPTGKEALWQHTTQCSEVSSYHAIKMYCTQCICQWYLFSIIAPIGSI